MTNVQDTINAFMEAAAAHQREPQHLERIDSLTKANDELGRHGQELELKIISYKAQIEQLNDKVRSLEVERDNYAFLQLQETDRLGDLQVVVDDAMHDLKLIQERVLLACNSVRKPKPTEAQPESMEGQKLQLEAQSPVVVEEPKPTEPPPIEPFVVEPVQEPHPVQATGEPAPKPYEGKKWSEVWPRVQTLDEWEKGGGVFGGWVN